MKLYSSKVGTNPRVAHIVVGYKGIDVERIEIDMVKAENRKADYMKINPTGTLPCLVTDSGMVLSETAAIAEYLEELKPDPVLIGATAEERAETRMWARRTDFIAIMPMANGFRHGEGKGFFGDRITIYEDLSPPSKAMARDGLAWFDKQLAGKQWLCGDRFTFADILFYCHIGFFAGLGQPVDDFATVAAYLERVAAHEAVVKHSDF